MRGKRAKYLRKQAKIWAVISSAPPEIAIKSAYKKCKKAWKNGTYQHMDEWSKDEWVGETTGVNFLPTEEFNK